MLLPALNKARQAPRSVQCKSNLHQIVLGCMYYAEDYKGYPELPNVANYATNRWGWFGGIFRYLGGQSPDWGQNFKVDGSEFPACGKCPADTSTSTWVWGYGGNYPNVMGYTVNPAYPFRPQHPPIRPGGFKTRVILAGDGWLNGIYSPAFFVPSVDLDHDGINDTHSALTGSPTTQYNAILFRHPGKTANFAFSDGSVVALTAKQVYQSTEDIWGFYLYPHTF
jgi:prepilin-type processing-associated H-X9-DG protein